jgi:hypothetical protein
LAAHKQQKFRQTEGIPNTKFSNLRSYKPHVATYFEVYHTCGSNDFIYKGKALQSWRGPEGSRRLRLSQISKLSAHEGGKGVSSTHRPPPPPPKKYSWNSFLLKAKSTPRP